MNDNELKDLLLEVVRTIFPILIKDQKQQLTKNQNLMSFDFMLNQNLVKIEMYYYDAVLNLNDCFEISSTSKCEAVVIRHTNVDSIRYIFDNSELKYNKYVKWNEILKDLLNNVLKEKLEKS